MKYSPEGQSLHRRIKFFRQVEIEKHMPALGSWCLVLSNMTKPAHVQVASPMSGTFYHSPAPGEPPFVKVGDKVTKGQTVGIIEAMKLMNEIEVCLPQIWTRCG